MTRIFLLLLKNFTEKESASYGGKMDVKFTSLQILKSSFSNSGPGELVWTTAHIFANGRLRYDGRHRFRFENRPRSLQHISSICFCWLDFLEKSSMFTHMNKNLFTIQDPALWKCESKASAAGSCETEVPFSLELVSMPNLVLFLGNIFKLRFKFCIFGHTVFQIVLEYYAKKAGVYKCEAQVLAYSTFPPNRSAAAITRIETRCKYLPFSAHVSISVSFIFHSQVYRR